MGQLLENIRYVLQNPETVIFAIAGLLFYPVLLAEIVSVTYVVFQAGVTTVEWYGRRRALSTKAIDSLCTSTQSVPGERERIALLSTAAFTPGVKGVLTSLAAVATLDRASAVRAVDDLEYTYRQRLDRTRVFIRVGPILGLMGTLIPISPALVAMAEGNIQQLSNSLRVAFGATVVGLLIGGLGYIISATRDRWYNRDIQDLEYVLERMGL